MMSILAVSQSQFVIIILINPIRDQDYEKD